MLRSLSLWRFAASLRGTWLPFLLYYYLQQVAVVAAVVAVCFDNPLT